MITNSQLVFCNKSNKCGAKSKNTIFTFTMVCICKMSIDLRILYETEVYYRDTWLLYTGREKGGGEPKKIM